MINKKKINQFQKFRIQNSRLGLREHAIEYYFTKYITNKGGICIKMPANSYPGIPDRLVINKTGTYFVELKTNSGRVSRLQHRTILKLKGFECNAFVLRGIKEVKDWLKTHT